MSRSFFAVALIFTLVLTAAIESRAGSIADARVGDSYIKVPTQLEKGTALSLKHYVTMLLDRKYVSPKKLYDPPFSGLEGKVHISVTRERALPVIAGGVASYAGNEKGLAASLYDGTIRIWSNKPCRKIALPGGSGAELVGYAPGSPTLAATDSEGDELYVFDLNSCERVPGEIPVKHAPVKKLALSATGEWLSYIDAFNTLYCGPVKGPLSEVTVLEGTPIMLGYTPSQGIMVAVEGTGRIIMWGMKNNSRLKTSEVPGGPYVSARMSGYTLCLTRDDGREVYWDITARKKVEQAEALKRAGSWVYMKGDSLVYSTGLDRWKITEHLGMPLFIVAYSEEAKLLRVRDLDGETRYYSILDGKEFTEVKTSDWEVVSARNGVYKVGKYAFKLYDMVCQVGIQRLYCRHLPGEGFFLWWEEAPDAVNRNPHPMELPVRKSMLASRKPLWVPLVQGNIR